ncbi:MAG: 50S ribosomal protein L6 [Gammaproteobacteria bacterium RIFCSPLOWO2_02_FULL_52_10]|nr:MAG: 50S ribosomal protein L6 [Gammaproteobacteria bacterium RIFCSPLOWO2_02_FULL_52_10]OGT87703.1 MAG: 50S ribosomal protein L6 [Gammaproteobacteria bacterium RIFCSPLOWO2_12_FULL_52_10]
MSRIAKNPIVLSKNVEVNISGNTVSVKGKKGEMTFAVHALVAVTREENVLKFTAKSNSKMARAIAGTTRAMLQNIVTGVTDGFEKKLTIVGIGYRAAVQSKFLNLTLGFSHPVNFPIPDGITIETPSQTEIIVKGIDKQKVGQVAANIRSYRAPEPYKGKGVRYLNEHILRKEAKKA